MKKVLCLLLAVLMVLSMFLVSCTKTEETETAGGQGGSENDTTASADTGNKSGEYTAEVKKLNRDFTIIRREVSGSWHLSINEIYAESVNGDKLNDAVFARNSKLQEKFGITVKEIPDAAPETTYREAMIAGEYVGDLIAHRLSSMRKLANANLLVDWASLENVDLTKDWWNHNITDSVTIAGKSFFVTGDALTLDDRGTWVLYFNKDLVNNAGLESPYKLVDSGEWTSAKMYEYMQKTAVDNNADGKYEYATDIIGYGGEKFNNWVHVAACNVTVSSRDAEGNIVIPDQPKTELLDAWAAVKSVMTSNLRYTSSGSAQFRNNTITFCGCNLAVVVKFPDSALNFGIIPFPKMNAEQKGYYTTPSHGQLGVLCIPTTVEADPAKDWTANGFISAAEQIAYMTEAFAYLSVDTVTPAFYDQVLKKQTVTDPESARNLEMILDTDFIILDPVCLFDFGDLGYQLFYDGTGAASSMADDLLWETFVSNYSSRVSAAREALKEYETITSVTA